MKRPGSTGFAYDWEGVEDPEYDPASTPEWEAELERIAQSVRASPVTAAVRLAYSEDQQRDATGKFGEGGGGASPSTTPARGLSSYNDRVEKYGKTADEWKASLGESFPNATIAVGPADSLLMVNFREPSSAYIDTATANVAGLHDMAEQFPEVAANIGYIGLGGDGMKGGGFGEVRPTGDRVSLFVNPSREALEITGSQSHLVEQDLNNARFAYGTSIHEFGHALDFTASEHATTDVLHSIRDRTSTLPFFQSANGLAVNDNHISSYARTNPPEYFAEAFAADQLGLGDRLLPNDRAMIDDAVARTRQGAMRAASPEPAAPEPTGPGIVDSDFSGSIVEEYATEKAARRAYSDDQERDATGKFGQGGGGSSTKAPADNRPTFAGSTVAPVQQLVDGKVSYNDAHGLDRPSDRDWSSVMADPELGAQIAADYDAMQDYNAAAEPAYDALASEVDAQFDYLTNDLGINVEFMDTDPYETVAQVKADIEENGHLGVLSTDATPPGHPYLSNEQNDRFRAVHDAFGHAAIGRGFDRNGEEAAFQSHAEMFTATALPALASETRGQNSALNYGGYGARGEFPPQKFDLLPTADLEPGDMSLAAAMLAATSSADDDNLYMVTGSHHVSMGRSFQKPPLPDRPAPPHTSLGRHAGARTSAMTPTKVTKLLERLAKIRANVGRRLLDKAELAYAEAVNRAGVKVQTRSRSRGTSKTMQAQVAAVVAAQGPYEPLLAALGLKESDLLAGGFVTYNEQAQAALEDLRRRQRAAIVAAGLDPEDFGFDDDRAEEIAVAAGATLLGAGLLAIARQRILGGINHGILGADGTPRIPGEVTGNVPARVVLDAMKVAEGRARAVMPSTADDIPTTGELPGAIWLEERLAELAAEGDLGIASGGGERGEVAYEWVHGFYGDPTTDFEPHATLGDETEPFTDRENDPRLLNELAWPEGDTFFPGDHDSCTCEWVPVG